MNHQIAIIRSFNSNDYSNMELVITSISDWTTVTDEELKALQKASTRMNFSVLVRPADEAAFAAKTVAEWLAIVEKEKALALEQKERAAAAKLAKAQKKLQLDRANKVALLKKLQEELKDE